MNRAMLCFMAANCGLPTAYWLLLFRVPGRNLAHLRQGFGSPGPIICGDQGTRINPPTPRLRWAGKSTHQPPSLRGIPRKRDDEVISLIPAVLMRWLRCSAPRHDGFSTSSLPGSPARASTHQHINPSTMPGQQQIVVRKLIPKLS